MIVGKHSVEPPVRSTGASGAASWAGDGPGHDGASVTRRAFAAVVVLGAAGAGAPAGAQAPSADAIVEGSLAATRVRDSFAEATFTLTARGGDQRTRRTTGYTKRQPNGVDTMRVVRFLSPPDIAGTGVLLIEDANGGDDMWIYLPAMRRIRRLSAANKKDSFVGTDFSYGDIIGHRTADWTHRLVGEEAVDGVRCHVVESVPKTAELGANTGYSRRMSWVRRDNLVAVRVDFWDRSGQPLKQVTAGDVQRVGGEGRWQPMLSEAANLQTGHRTTIRIHRFNADQNLSDDVFSPRALER